MRVIAGRYRGARIYTKSRQAFRPTCTSIKEWIFQVVEPYLPGSRFLDLFAGSGSLGIEALSRGSGTAVFVDWNTGPLIQRNLNAVNPEAEIKIFQEDVLKFLHRRFPEQFRFSIAVADPPYTYDSYARFLSTLYTSPLMEPESIFILESGKHSTVDIPEPFLPEVRRKSFGETMVTIYQKEQS